MGEHHGEGGDSRGKKLLTLLAAATFAVGLIFTALNLPYTHWLFAVALAAGGVPVALAALRSLARGKITINQKRENRRRLEFLEFPSKFNDIVGFAKMQTHGNSFY